VGKSFDETARLRTTPLVVFLSSAPQMSRSFCTHDAETRHGSPAEATIVESSSFHHGSTTSHLRRLNTITRIALRITTLIFS